MNLVGIAEQAIGEIKSAQLKNLYQRDFIAWQADVLGLRTYKKMAMICEEALFGEKNRTAIKSSNGVSKSFQISAMISWAGTVFEPGEALSIVTAPSENQVKRGIWKNLRDFRTRAASRGFMLPGSLDESLGWKFASAEGNIDIAYGKVPSKGNEVSVFQGIRSTFGRTYVFVEEAGGIGENLFVAAEAVLTGKNARGFFIGNPDHVGGPWQKVFEDDKYAIDFNRFTVNSFDLPWNTGETVYPDDPAMEQVMNENLTTGEWVEQKRRLWGEKSNWFMSKVLGEFPKDGGTGFFTPGDVASGRDTTIEPGTGPVIFGLDVARMGMDESVLYMNDGGRVRLLEAWEKTDTYTTSKKVHEYALQYQPAEIRVDGTGVGAGVWDNLFYNEEFAGPWDVIGIEGAASSPDINKYTNRRAYIYSSTKEQLAEGLLDLDPEDKDLLDELALIKYKFSPRGGITIADKASMKNEIGGSPDRADALVYAVCDLSPWTGNPLNEFKPGEKILLDPAAVQLELENWNPFYGNAWNAF